MKYLLDTHALLWLTTNQPQLSQKVKDIYLNVENEILLSAASLWELAIKSSLGKIHFEKGLEAFIDVHVKGNNIEILKIEIPHVIRIEKLPFHHRDPFDRLIIAQAIENNLRIISSDKTFDKYKIKRIWR
jgi:PIN domain nuclease of toxin-antitoxin system